MGIAKFGSIYKFDVSSIRVHVGYMRLMWSFQHVVIYVKCVADSLLVVQISTLINLSDLQRLTCWV